MRSSRSFVVLGLLALPILGFPCAVVPQHGAKISVTNETALIVWNDARKEEIFVREAGFAGTGKSFGFIVPTPSVPRLWAADGSVYNAVSKIIESHHPLPAMKGNWRLNTAGVAVIRSQRVGDYQATILKGSDAGAVERWLKANGYPTEPKTRAWLAPYVARGWALTAFKVAVHRTRGSLPPVAMAFRADRPFYPYREPASDTPTYGRSLRVFVLSSAPMSAGISGKPWKAEVEHREALSSSEARTVAENLRKSKIAVPRNPHLTSFIDRAFSRNGADDVVFTPMRTASALPTLGGAGGLAALLLSVPILRRRHRRD